MHNYTNILANITQDGNPSCHGKNDSPSGSQLIWCSWCKSFVLLEVWVISNGKVMQTKQERKTTGVLEQMRTWIWTKVTQRYNCTTKKKKKQLQWVNFGTFWAKVLKAVVHFFKVLISAYVRNWRWNFILTVNWKRWKVVKLRKYWEETCVNTYNGSFEVMQWNGSDYRHRQTLSCQIHDLKSDLH